MNFLSPVCPDCGFRLSPKIGTVVVVCVLCGSEFELTRKPQGLDEFVCNENHDHNFKRSEYSHKNLEDGK